MVLIFISLMISDTFMRTFRVHVGHLCVLFGKISIQFLCLFLNHIVWVGFFFFFFFLLFSCVNSLHSLGINPLSMWFVMIFFHSMSCFFILFVISFVTWNWYFLLIKKIFVLMKSRKNVMCIHIITSWIQSLSTFATVTSSVYLSAYLAHFRMNQQFPIAQHPSL